MIPCPILRHWLKKCFVGIRSPLLVRAVLKIRARLPTSQTGFPHRSTQEQVFEGQRIPEGTLFIANIWFVIIELTGCLLLIVQNPFRGILHDENAYPEPFKFDPARYLGDEVTGVNSPAFGFGRRSVAYGDLSSSKGPAVAHLDCRVCPGRDLAYITVWITFAQSIATLEIRKAVDANGKEINPSLDYTPGTVR
jgi:Cytochrome P450